MSDPILLDENQLLSLCNLTRSACKRWISEGILPVPRNFCGIKRWHKTEVEAALAKAWGLQMAAQQADQRKSKAMDAINGW